MSAKKKPADELPTYEDLARTCNKIEREAKIYRDALVRLAETFEFLALGMPRAQKKLGEAMAHAAHECRAALKLGAS